MLMSCLGDIPAATAEYVELAVAATRIALKRNKVEDWASASGAAKYLRAIAAKITEKKKKKINLQNWKPWTVGNHWMKQHGTSMILLDVLNAMPIKQKLLMQYKGSNFPSYGYIQMSCAQTAHWCCRIDLSLESIDCSFPSICWLHTSGHIETSLKAIPFVGFISFVRGRIVV